MLSGIQIATLWSALRTSGYLHMLVANFAIQFLGLLSVLLVAKLIDPVQLALVRSAQAYFAVFAIVAGCGVSAPILRYCADVTVSRHRRQGLMWVALRRTMAVSFVIVGVGVAFCLSNVEESDTLAVYLVFLLMLPAYSVTSVFYAFLQAEQKFASLARTQAVIKLVSVVAVVFATSHLGLVGFLLATLLTTYIAVLPLWLVNRIPASALAVAQSIKPSDFDKLAALSVVGMGLTTVASSADFMLLQMVGADRHEVGIYSLASIFLAAAMTITGAFQSVVTPKFTGLLSAPDAFRKKLRYWSLLAFLLGVISAASCLVVAWLLERFFFETRYAGFSAVLAVLLLKHVVWSSYAVIGAALVGAGLLAGGTKISVVTTILVFAVGYPLCVEFGVWGAAWTHVTVAVVSLLLVLLAKRVELPSVLAEER